VDEAETDPEGKRDARRKAMTSGQILVVSDDTEFVRALSACWRKENHSLSMTAVSTRVGGQADSSGYLLVVGPLREGLLFRRRWVCFSIQPCAPWVTLGSRVSPCQAHGLAPGSGISGMDGGSAFRCAGSVAPDRCGRARARSGTQESRAPAIWRSGRSCWKHGREWSMRLTSS